MQISPFDGIERYLRGEKRETHELGEGGYQREASAGGGLAATAAASAAPARPSAGCSLAASNVPSRTRR